MRQQPLVSRNSCNEFFLCLVRVVDVACDANTRILFNHEPLLLQTANVLAGTQSIANYMVLHIQGKHLLSTSAAYHLEIECVVSVCFHFMFQGFTRAAGNGAHSIGNRRHPFSPHSFIHSFSRILEYLSCFHVHLAI